MDTNALFKLSYGLYIITANENNKDNGCVINTAMQLTSDPCKIQVVVNKKNYTCGMIQRTKKFNLSILAENINPDMLKLFGYQSGKDVDKFIQCFDTKRSPNGILYITKGTNAFLSGYVVQEIDLDTHIMFIARLVESEVLSDIPTVTYDYYQRNLKPKPDKPAKKGWICKICGYVYDGEELPADYICPLCKHGATDFEKI